VAFTRDLHEGRAGYKVTYFGEFYYLNSSCIEKSIILLFSSSLRDKFALLQENSTTDVSRLVSGGHAGAYPDGHQHGVSTQISILDFERKTSPHILHKKNCCDLNLGESLCIVTFFLFSDSGLNVLNGFDFYFDLF